MADNNEQSRGGIQFNQLYGNNTIRIPDKKPGSGVLSYKIDVDVSEALTGLKALQREAREAAKALRELESAKLEAQKRSQAFPRFPFEVHPNKVVTSYGTGGTKTTDGGGISSKTTTPEHVKKYGKGEGCSNKGEPSTGGVWFDDGESDKSIADDITRSYGLGGDNE